MSSLPVNIDVADIIATLNGAIKNAEKLRDGDEL